MDGNWRTRASEKPTIRSINNGGGVTGGYVDLSTVNGKSKKTGTKAPAQKRGKRRYYR